MMFDVKSFTRGVLRGAAQEQTDIARWRTALQSPMLEGRRIGMVQIQPGIGATTLARATTRLLAESRTVLAADLAPASKNTGLARAFTTEFTPFDPVRAAARTTEEATNDLPHEDGVWAMWPHPQPDRAATWVNEISPIVRFFDTAVTDFGTVDPRTSMPAVASVCDVVCVVSAPDRNSVEIAMSLADGVNDLPTAPAGMVAVVDRTGSHRAALKTIIAHAPVPVAAIGKDSGLARSGRPSTMTTQASLMQFASMLVSKGAVR